MGVPGEHVTLALEVPLDRWTDVGRGPKETVCLWVPPLSWMATCSWGPDHWGSFSTLLLGCLLLSVQLHRPESPPHKVPCDPENTPPTFSLPTLV